MQELLVEHLVERAYQRMIAERRDSIHYDDVGKSCDLIALHLAAIHFDMTLLGLIFVLAGPHICACNAATAVSKWPATDFLRGGILSPFCASISPLCQPSDNHQLASKSGSCMYAADIVPQTMCLSELIDMAKREVEAERN